MELYRKVRLACGDGMSPREAARNFNTSRETVDKAMAFSVPPRYGRTAPIKRPKLDGFDLYHRWLGWLEGDLTDAGRKSHQLTRCGPSWTRPSERLRPCNAASIRRKPSSPSKKVAALLEEMEQTSGRGGKS